MVYKYIFTLGITVDGFFTASAFNLVMINLCIARNVIV